jgi:hypothetical protein
MNHSVTSLSGAVTSPSRSVRSLSFSVGSLRRSVGSLRRPAGRVFLAQTAQEGFFCSFIIISAEPATPCSILET